MRGTAAALLLAVAQPLFAAGHGDATDTLDRLAAAYTDDPRLSAVTIDSGDLAITATLPDGTDNTS